MNNSFGGNIFGAMWEAANDNTEERAKEVQRVMKLVINKKTGALSDAVDIQKNSDGSYQVGINENKLMNDERNIGRINYTPYYYYGSRPHVIRAKGNNYLHWKVNGKDHFAKSVRHPGNKPHNFIQDTLDKIR